MNKNILSIEWCDDLGEPTVGVANFILHLSRIPEFDKWCRDYDVALHDHGYLIFVPSVEVRTLLMLRWNGYAIL